MAKCVKCAARKGKRPCPALGEGICPSCCAENRLVNIPCPRDCQFLQGEIYQHRRRRELASSRGRDFLALQQKLFQSREAGEFAFRLQADLYYFNRRNGAADDATVAAALETLKGFLSKIFVPPEGSSPLAQFLIQRIGDARRYPTGPGFTAEDRRRALGALSAHVRSLARDGSRNYHELVSSFFDSLDFEADLDYSPEDPLPAENPAAPAEPNRTPGGIILPR